VGAAAKPDPLLAAQAAYWERVRLARRDLATFIETTAKDEGGRRLVLHHIHRAWIWHLHYCWSRGLHAQILAPFGSGKSSALAVPLAAFLVGRDPQVRVKVVCNGDDFAMQRVQGVSQIITSPEYREIFPGVRRGPKWSDHALFVRREGNAIDPTVHARGLFSKGVGGRCDYLVFDDICDQQNTLTEELRRKGKSFARSTWLSRLDGEGARALAIATAWHADDASHDFLHDPLWCTLVQSVSEDFEHYDQVVYNADSTYHEGALGAFPFGGHEDP
jgi:hypothetical protein